MAARKKKVVPFDPPAPAPSVVDRLADQQADMYRDHPEVVARAKAFAAQRLADAMATEAEARASMAREMLAKVAYEQRAADSRAFEAEARASMAKEMLAKVSAERRAMDVRLALGARDDLLAQHTQLLRLAQGWLLGEHGTDPHVQGRAQSVITLASELRLATRES